MIFSELYSAYYNAVAKIITAALSGKITEKELPEYARKYAFSESVLTILPSLKSGKWPLLCDDLTPVLHHEPTMPLTTLEKRWLKSISEDPRFRLFGAKLDGLDDVEPLFRRDDYKVFDSYADGDNYEDECYIKNFRTVYSAIKNNKPVKVAMLNRHKVPVKMRFYPKGFEYSAKDDKIRIIADGCKFRYFNLGRIISCSVYDGNGKWTEKPEPHKECNLTLLIKNERNALERVMLHFAHFEKSAKRTDDDEYYILNLKYYADDETEIVIRVLSFGPNVKVLSPESFVNLIKERLNLQIGCELK